MQVRLRSPGFGAPAARQRRRRRPADVAPHTADAAAQRKGRAVPAAQSIVSGLAGRYASALFDLAEEQKALAKVEKDMATLRSMLDESADLRRLVASPRLGRVAQARALTALADKAGLSDTTKKFLGTLAINGRLGVLAKSLDDFAKLLAHHRGEIAADVTTAQPLTDTQRKALTSKLKAAMGRDVAIQETVDAGLIGGLMVKVGSRLIDGSLKTKLNRLELSMKGV
ncbi:hypothetical protein CCR85_14535 [Rhodothalassium salexigens]|nr:F0F1 ATP synthase subunit delta [Rhodothalassium salexigens]MBK5912697.1 hypothetical protein [Rhodothalassium salexigens]